MESERMKKLLAAYDKADAVKQKLFDEFNRTNLPVDMVATVSFAGEDLPGVGVSLSRDPTKDEMARLPDSRDGVSIRYYIVRDGATVRYPSWDVTS